MAHIIEVPVAVEFAPNARRWEVCEIQPADLPKVETPWTPLALVAPILEPERGITLRRIEAPSLMERVCPTFYTAMDVLELGQPPKHLHSRESLFQDSTLEILVSFPRTLKPNRHSDPWKMRQEFFQLPQTTRELSRFLNKWGSWGGAVLQKHPYSLNVIGSEYIEYVVPEDAWTLQASYKAALAGDAAKWLSESGRMPTPTRRSTPPFLASRDVLCTHSIQTTITMDKLADAPYRLCARVDCSQVFKLESNHSRAYCSQSCAHLVSVRRGREAKRQANANAAKGKK